MIRYSSEDDNVYLVFNRQMVEIPRNLFYHTILQWVHKGKLPEGYGKGSKRIIKTKNGNQNWEVVCINIKPDPEIEEAEIIEPLTPNHDH